jgi:hypothetical protein
MISCLGNHIYEFGLQRVEVGLPVNLGVVERRRGEGVFRSLLDNGTGAAQGPFGR